MKDGPALPEDYMRVPARINLVREVLDRHVREGAAERTAVHYEGQALTYRQLLERVNRFGNALKKLGVRKGDRFIVRARNCPEYVVAVLGGMKIGAVPLPTNTLFRSWELEHILKNSGSRLLFSMQDLLEPVNEARRNCPELEHVVLFDHAGPGQILFADLVRDASTSLDAADTAADDPAFMIYTSGTTGVPKGVAHAHRWIRGTGDPVCRVIQQLTPADVTFFPNELSFMFAFGCNFLYPLYAGASIVLWGGRFQPARCLECVQRYRVTQLIAVPTMLRKILNESGLERAYDLSSLRGCYTSGEPLPAPTYEEFLRRFGVEIFDGLGQTEIHLFVGNWPGQKVKPGSMGRPYPGHRVAVVDEDGRPCPAGQIGHLVLDRTDPGLTTGYFQMAGLWSERLKGDWYYTGDLACVDEEGYYWYASRSDDMIKSRAYLISPKEVESTLMEHPAVLECGVVGVPDPVMGQRVKAFLVLRTGHAPSEALQAELASHTAARIAPYKVPKEMVFVPDLPKTATGKILRRKLREG